MPFLCALLCDVHAAFTQETSSEAVAQNCIRKWQNASRRFCSVSEPQKGFDRYIMSFSTDGCRLGRSWEGATRVRFMSSLMARAKTAGRSSRYYMIHDFMTTYPIYNRVLN